LLQLSQEELGWLLSEVESGEEDVDLGQGEAKALVGAVTDGTGSKEGGVEAEARLAGESDDGPIKLALGGP
jgi:hypothetical protein